MSIAHRLIRFRQRLYGVLEVGAGAGGLSAAINWILIGLIITTLAATVLESVPRLSAAYGEIFEAIETAALVIFSIEYATRLWIAVEHPPWRRLGAIRSRLHSP